MCKLNRPIKLELHTSDTYYNEVVIAGLYLLPGLLMSSKLSTLNMWIPTPSIGSIQKCENIRTHVVTFSARWAEHNSAQH